MISTLFIIVAIIGFMFLNAVKNSIKPIVFVILMFILVSEYRSEAQYVLDKAAQVGDSVKPHVKNAARKGVKSLNDFLNKDSDHSYDHDENDSGIDRGSALAQEVLGLK